jgi:hypothetical protein
LFLPIFLYQILLAHPSVVGRVSLGGLIIVQDHFLLLELPAMLLAKRHAALSGDGVVEGEPVVGMGSRYLAKVVDIWGGDGW